MMRKRRLVGEAEVTGRDRTVTARPVVGGNAEIVNDCIRALSFAHSKATAAGAVVVYRRMDAVAITFAAGGDLTKARGRRIEP